MEQLEQCPCCHSKQLKPDGVVSDFFLTNESFHLSKCADCGFVFTNPRPDITEIGKYYQTENYISHHSSNTSLFHRLYRLIRDYMFGKKMNYIRAYFKKPWQKVSLMDYGAASGDFLAYCKSQNIEKTIGIEQDTSCRKAADEIHGIQLQTPEELSLLPQNSLDVITLWHVLEHIHNADEVISMFHKILNEEGVLVIAVPNINSLDRKIYSNYWAAYDVPRHIYHFNTATISVLLKRLGFTLAGKHALPFDAYYISLHSEWLKKSNSFISILRAVKNGFLSNWSARKTGEYSSLVYVFKKTKK